MMQPENARAPCAGNAALAESKKTATMMEAQQEAAIRQYQLDRDRREQVWHSLRAPLACSPEGLGSICRGVGGVQACSGPSGSGGAPQLWASLAQHMGMGHGAAAPMLHLNCTARCRRMSGSHPIQLHSMRAGGG